MFRSMLLMADAYLNDPGEEKTEEERKQPRSGPRLPLAGRGYVRTCTVPVTMQLCADF